MASGGAPPRGQRGQHGFMGKDLSATGEDILPAFPSSCSRSPWPRFSSAGGPPLSQLGCLITPPVPLPQSRALIPERPGQLPGTVGCTHSCAALGAPHLPGCPSSPSHPQGVLRQPTVPLSLSNTPCFPKLPLGCFSRTTLKQRSEPSSGHLPPPAPLGLIVQALLLGSQGQPYVA